VCVSLLSSNSIIWLLSSTAAVMAVVAMMVSVLPDSDDVGV
jgi:hypothetical protein